MFDVSGIQAKQVVKYVVMPGIIPRLRSLFTSGFGFAAYMIAQVYAMVRLLEPQHPYLDLKNIGRFGVRHVVAAAANNLVISRNNIDQIVVFSLVLFAIALFFLQIAVLVLSFLIGGSSVLAAAAWPYPEGPSIFVTGRPDDDVALMLLDRVFGVPDFFGSCVSQAGVTCAGAQSPSGAFPWPFHMALHQLFRFYSTGILLVGTLIFLYLLFVIVAETAMSGTPFGQRFKNVWVPIRLVVAIGLLMPLPITYGAGVTTAAYSAGQYIAFAAAKYGSSMATNAWIRYNNAIAAHADFAGGGGVNPLGEKETIVAMPKQIDAAVFANMISTVHTCAMAYFAKDPDIDKPPKAGGVNYPDTLAEIDAYREANKIKPYLLKTPQAWMTMNADPALEVAADTTYEDALGFYNRGDIVITFGRDNDPEDDGYDVEPLCGQIRIPVTDHRDPSAAPYLGTVELQKLYFDLVRNYWFDNGLAEDYIDFAGRFVLLNMHLDTSACEMGCAGDMGDNPNLPSCAVAAGKKPCELDPIGAAWRQNAVSDVQTTLDTNILAIWQAYNNDGAEIQMDPALLDRGWGGAGIWFTKIAQVNGAWMSAVINQPSLDKYPAIMEGVREARASVSSKLEGAEQFNPEGTGEDAQNIDQKLKSMDPVAQALATVFYQAHQYWNQDQTNMTTSTDIDANAMKSAMNMIFGTYGLFSMTEENVQTHPLSQLTALGKGLVEASIRNIAISTGSAVMGGLTRVMSLQAGALAEAAAGFFNATAFIGLTAGLVLYYVVPFLPFVYFYFAVGSWIKTIFEAMVGIPLWALAHLRLDGDGLPGEAASNGYFLIFEIFARPILTVFGLVAAMVIFTAQVRVLNFIWPLVTANAGGFNAAGQVGIAGDVSFKREIVDQFFFTVVYAIVVYMMATAAFKLVDSIPDNILRWMGIGVSSFGDLHDDPTGSLTRYAALGGMTAGREAASGVMQLGRGAGSAVGQVGQGLASALVKPFGR